MADEILKAGRVWLRDFQSDGIPASGVNMPSKTEGRSVFGIVNQSVADLSSKVETVVGTPSIIRSTWTALAATPGIIAGQRGEVIDDPGIHIDSVVGGAVSNAGIYTWVTSPAGWQRISDNNRNDTFSHTLLSHTADSAFDTRSPVFSMGEPTNAQLVTSTFSGNAQPFLWDGTPFDLVKVWLSVEDSSNPVAISVWTFDRLTRLMTATVQPLQKSGFVWVKFPRQITTSVTASGYLYVTAQVKGGLSRMTSFAAVKMYVVPDTPATHSQYFTTTASADERLSEWSIVGDYVNRPLLFQLFDSHNLDAAPSRPKLTAPRASQPVLAPKIFGRVGSELNIYLRSAISSEATKIMHISEQAISAGVGTLLNERWTLTAASPIAAPMVMRVFDPENFNVLESLNFNIDVRAANCAGGATRSMLCLGDSNTAYGLYTQKMLDMAAANPSNLSITLKGTKGSGTNKHEGVGGFKTLNWYQPQNSADLANNPFVQTLGGKFNAAYYLSSTGQTAWNTTLIALGTNDAFNETSDGSVHGQMDVTIQMLKEIMGLTVGSGVTSILSTNGGARFLIAIVLPPVSDQDGFGNYGYKDTQTRARYRRNQVIESYRLIQAFGGMESSGIGLLPWNTAVDPYYGFEFNAAAAANADTAQTVARHANGVHPNLNALGGHQQMGRSAYDTYSALIAANGW